MNNDQITNVVFNHDTFDDAIEAHRHHDLDVRIAVTVAVPTKIQGEPFDDMPFISEDDKGAVWITTGETATLDNGVPIVHFVDVDSLPVPSSWKPTDMLRHVKTGAEVDMVNLWIAEYGRDGARRMWIDPEGQIRRRVNFETDRAIEYRRANGGVAGTLNNHPQS